MRLKGLIFDFDGTLANTLPICIEGFRRVYRRYLGREFTDAEVCETFGPSEEGSFQRLMPKRWEEALQYYYEEYEALHDACVSPFDGIFSLLDRLKADDVRLAIVTGKGIGTMKISARYTGVERFFERIGTGSPKGSVKAQQIRQITAEWGLKPSEVGYVGDVAYDVVSSRDAGVVAISAAWAESADYASLLAAEPDFIPRSPNELWMWLNDRTGS